MITAYQRRPAQRQWWNRNMSYEQLSANAMMFASWHSMSCLCPRCLAQDWAWVGHAPREALYRYRQVLKYVRPPDHGGTVVEAWSFLVASATLSDVEPGLNLGGVEQAEPVEDVEPV